MERIQEIEQLISTIRAINISDIRSYATTNKSVANICFVHGINNSQGTQQSSSLKQIYHHQLEKLYSYQVGIRGDGNCFFRAVMLLKIFYLSSEGTTAPLKEFIKKVSSLKYIHLENTNKHLILTEDLQVIFHIFLMKILAWKEEQLRINLGMIINEYNSLPEVDLAACTITRALIHNCFKQYQNHPDIAPFLDEEMKASVEQKLLKQNEYAEGIIIPLAAQVFQTEIVIQNISADESKTSKGLSSLSQTLYKPLDSLQETQTADLSKLQNQIHLLFIKDHYDAFILNQHCSSYPIFYKIPSTTFSFSEQNTQSYMNFLFLQKFKLQSDSQLQKQHSFSSSQTQEVTSSQPKPIQNEEVQEKCVACSKRIFSFSYPVKISKLSSNSVHQICKKCNEKIQNLQSNKGKQTITINQEEYQYENNNTQSQPSQIKNSSDPFRFDEKTNQNEQQFSPLPPQHNPNRVQSCFVPNTQPSKIDIPQKQLKSSVQFSDFETFDHFKAEKKSPKNNSLNKLTYLDETPTPNTNNMVSFQNSAFKSEFVVPSNQQNQGNILLPESEDEEEVATLVFSSDDDDSDEDEEEGQISVSQIVGQPQHSNNKQQTQQTQKKTNTQTNKHKKTATNLIKCIKCVQPFNSIRYMLLGRKMALLCSNCVDVLIPTLKKDQWEITINNQIYKFGESLIARIKEQKIIDKKLKTLNLDETPTMQQNSSLEKNKSSESDEIKPMRKQLLSHQELLCHQCNQQQYSTYEVMLIKKSGEEEKQNVCQDCLHLFILYYEYPSQFVKIGGNTFKISQNFGKYLQSNKAKLQAKMDLSQPDQSNQKQQRNQILSSEKLLCNQCNKVVTSSYEVILLKQEGQEEKQRVCQECVHVFMIYYKNPSKTLKINENTYKITDLLGKYLYSLQLKQIVPLETENIKLCIICKKIQCKDLYPLKIQEMWNLTFYIGKDCFFHNYQNVQDKEFFVYEKTRFQLQRELRLMYNAFVNAQISEISQYNDS